ncbi:MAG: Spy/CpxP family protein refolding chaperone [Acidobacteriota bacterium]|nr:Spy/CpxP family protein refolding chaperone [Acidobacteriota bacterium]
MYPGFLHWRRQREHCGERRVGMGFEPGGGRGRHAAWEYNAGGEDDAGQFGGGSFGVRRPLRFLAYKLELSEPQVSELARILDELKTERAQAAVDGRRALSSFADAVAGDAFDEAKAAAGAALRLQSAERLRTAVVNGLGRIHKLLEPPQRARLAYLIRTGVLSL